MWEMEGVPGSIFTDTVAKPMGLKKSPSSRFLPLSSACGREAFDDARCYPLLLDGQDHEDDEVRQEVIDELKLSRGGGGEKAEPIPIGLARSERCFCIMCGSLCYIIPQKHKGMCHPCREKRKHEKLTE